MKFYEKDRYWRCRSSFGTKIDAPRKTRDFLGFSSFFAVFLAFLKIEKYSEPKDANRVFGVVEGI